MAYKPTISSLVSACFTAVLAFVISSSAIGQRVLLDRVIALVDEDVVLQSELDMRMEDIRSSAARDNRTLPPEEEMREDVLEALIIESIQLQMAEQVSIRFDDDTINRVLSSMADNNGMTFDQYVAALESSGVYLQTRDQVRRQMMLQELRKELQQMRTKITGVEEHASTA